VTGSRKDLDRPAGLLCEARIVDDKGRALPGR